jgi:tyrosinase
MANVLARENILNWGEDSKNLYLFRRAIEEMQKISDAALMDERGYQWVAGVHGGFGGEPYCEHGTDEFLVWHRPYILDYEIKLRDQIKIIADQAAADNWRLPYWAWEAADVDGLPGAFTVETYDDNGTTKPNPLYQRPYQLPYTPPTGTETYRNLRPLSQLQAQRQPAIDAMEETDFVDFNSAIGQPHNMVHVWVAGFMNTYRSSFDPIFWLHHANIDRFFWQWQKKNGDSSIPDIVKNFTCRPFRFANNTAQAFFDTRALGYTYADSRNSALEVDADEVKDTRNYNLGKISLDFNRARLHFHGMNHPEDSYEVRVFANNKTVDADTLLSAASGYLGSFALLGHGNCPGAPGHCSIRTKSQFVGDVRAPHHLIPYNTFINVGRGLKALKPEGGAVKVGITLLVLDMDGKPVPSSSISFDNMSLTTH